MLAPNQSERRDCNCEPGSLTFGLNMTQIAHELLFHDNSLMRFPNPSFNFFFATVRQVEQLIEASFAHLDWATTFFSSPRPIKHDQSCYIADSYVI